MLVRIKQARTLADGKPGSDIDLTEKGATEKVVLKFRPLDSKNPDVDHVCEVNDTQVLGRLLAIPEGFEIHPSAVKGSGSTQGASAQRAAAKPVNVDAVLDDAARRIVAGEFDVAYASPQIAREHKLKAEDVTAELDKRVAALTEAANGGQQQPEGNKAIDDMTRDELVTLVTKKNGKAPAPSTSMKKLREMAAQPAAEK
jgi:hypothetical protein